MTREITNYDGGVVTRPARIERPASVEELQDILRDSRRFPGPVRPVGSFHSLTPCAASSGTLVRMSGLKSIRSIDRDTMTITAQAGLQLVEAARVLRRDGLQFPLNMEIGNITLGSAACCQTKDGLDGVEYGQLSSYVTRIKWVSPSGELQEASEETAELLALARASYGLCGIVYEATFAIKPLEMIRINYFLCDVDDLSPAMVSQILAENEGMVCWTLGRTVVIQTRNRTDRPRNAWMAGVRRLAWSDAAAFVGHAIRRHSPNASVINLLDRTWFRIQLASYQFIAAAGGLSFPNPDKIIDYGRTPRAARYAFTFWAFPREDWVANLHSYLAFSERHFRAFGFRCNLPLGSYYIRHDTSSLLSYSYDGDIISIDPIHACSERDRAAWEHFLRAFNHWAHDRGGIPLLNQSPFLERSHVEAAYGDRWKQLSNWVRTQDPNGRMLNPFFKDLQSE